MSNEAWEVEASRAIATSRPGYSSVLLFPPLSVLPLPPSYGRLVLQPSLRDLLRDLLPEQIVGVAPLRYRSAEGVGLRAVAVALR